MHGIILNGLKDSAETYDGEPWNRISDRADLARRMFIPATTYPDERVHALIGSAAGVSGEDAADFNRTEAVATDGGRSGHDGQR